MTRSGYFADRGVVVVFEFCRAAVTQGAVQPGAVVPGDVLHDRAAGRRPGRPCLVAGELAFERGEKLSATALSQHWPLRPTDKVTRQSSAKAANAAEVYCPAPVGMEDHPGRGVPGGDRVGQRVRGQFGAQVIGEREPDDAAGGDVDDGGQV
jgi:hypothetical protein